MTGRSNADPFAELISLVNRCPRPRRPPLAVSPLGRRRDRRPPPPERDPPGPDPAPAGRPRADPVADHRPGHRRARGPADARRPGRHRARHPAEHDQGRRAPRGPRPDRAPHRPRRPPARAGRRDPGRRGRARRRPGPARTPSSARASPSSTPTSWPAWRRRSTCSTASPGRWRHEEALPGVLRRHVQLAEGPQLQAVLRRPADLADRHVADDDRPDAAGAAADGLRHRPRHPHRLPVPARPAARRVGRHRSPTGPTSASS